MLNDDLNGDFMDELAIQKELYDLRPIRRMTAPLIHDRELDLCLQSSVSPSEDYEEPDTPLRGPFG